MSTLGVISLMLVALGGLAVGFLATRTGHSPEDEGGDAGSGGGGGGPHRPGRPPSPGGGDPVWWPEFERQFAAYVRSQTAVPEHVSGFPYPYACEKRR
jgi:hypothetical protein